MLLVLYLLLFSIVITAVRYPLTRLFWFHSTNPTYDSVNCYYWIRQGRWIQFVNCHSLLPTLKCLIKSFLMGCCATTGLFEGHSNTLWLVVTPVPLRLLALEALRPPHSCFVQVFHKTGSIPLIFKFRAAPVAAGLCGSSWFFWLVLLNWPVCPSFQDTDQLCAPPSKNISKGTWDNLKCQLALLGDNESWRNWGRYHSRGTWK